MPQQAGALVAGGVGVRERCTRERIDRPRDVAMEQHDFAAMDLEREDCRRDAVDDGLRTLVHLLLPGRASGDFVRSTAGQRSDAPGRIVSLPVIRSIAIA